MTQKTLAVTGLERKPMEPNLASGHWLAIRTGTVLGLIGNGTEVPSLKVLADQTDYDQGTIDKPKDYRIAYLDQNPELIPTDHFRYGLCRRYARIGSSAWLWGGQSCCYQILIMASFREAFQLTMKPWIRQIFLQISKAKHRPDTIRSC